MSQVLFRLGGASSDEALDVSDKIKLWVSTDSSFVINLGLFVEFCSIFIYFLNKILYVIFSM